MAVLHFLVMWSLKDRCWSSHAPRYLIRWLFTISSQTTLMLVIVHFDACCLLPNSENSVLDRFIFNLFKHIHSLISSRNFSKFLIASSSFIIGVTFICWGWSSAKPLSKMLFGTWSGKVLEYKLNSIGPAHDPFGTDKGKVLRPEYSKATCTLMNWGQRYNQNYFSALSVIPNLFSKTFSSIAWSTVSNAALKSSVPSAVTCAHSIVHNMSLTTLNNAVSQLWFSL